MLSKSVTDSNFQVQKTRMEFCASAASINVKMSTAARAQKGHRLTVLFLRLLRRSRVRNPSHQVFSLHKTVHSIDRRRPPVTSGQELVFLRLGIIAVVSEEEKAPASRLHWLPTGKRGGGGQRLGVPLGRRRSIYHPKFSGHFGPLGEASTRWNGAAGEFILK
ncbi:hypothetical protein L596_018055 [Steinernema carpocapsae]|uniref:Uncharacterized protein n=1 Tax=Steinernema carpocapsae TaxID=34508 RepID=A0A4U5N496_STECR|nr:hypothetical protein L596_018055 [Steinernema carpocapsae]